MTTYYKTLEEKSAGKVVTIHDDGNNCVGVRMINESGDYATRTFEDSRLRDENVQHASSLLDQVESGEKTWEEAKDAF